MKAVSPVRSIRKPALYFSEHNLGSSRSKSSSDDPLSLLYNMNDCYSRLKELVPSLPQNKSVSKMEILQHVIDYILDLQIALDQNPQQQILGQSPPKKTVRSLGAGSIISFQVFRSWSKNRGCLCFFFFFWVPCHLPGLRLE
uniref:DNA-binding protein inhibitor ID-4 n=1 Tax=Cyprinus carpio carpio TaxID=630221 RepID=A0A9J8B499_CYPCA